MYTTKVSKLKIPLDIQNARNARRKDGSCLEFGLDYHISHFDHLLKTGYPNDTQVKNESWIQQCSKDRDLLLEWLEDFKSNYQQYNEAQETIQKCESLLDNYTSQVQKVKIPLDIQKARNARKSDGSNLEYGLEYHLKQMNNLVNNNYIPTKTNNFLVFFNFFLI